MDIILVENSLKVLTVDPRVERGKRTRNIPNWAMDLNDSVKDGVDMHHRRWGNGWIYSACLSDDVDKQALLEAAADPQPHFNVLGLTSIMIDTVDVLSPVSLSNGYFETKPNVVISQMLEDWMDLARNHSRLGIFRDKAFHRLVVGGAMQNSEQKLKIRPNEDDLRQVADFVQNESRGN
ncbi:uncharacterized protein EAF01_009041 [Botrytis porri]|uniref:Uncharacterized protein n=1 Tax=Botrytis porri TaxID=87229 RepID=A0A4Z1K4H5_9HELO|nr:uncharacterized protein EAF01_009041 [Botrytis porri]KAF7896638.1 hypothetical protein EAF01_009041 [Botrytis porri]TGO81019.1 hypothetical protein BPOR_1420g00010 [Botrytis porri]